MSKVRKTPNYKPSWTSRCSQFLSVSFSFQVVNAMPLNVESHLRVLWMAVTDHCLSDWMAVRTTDHSHRTVSLFFVLNNQIQVTVGTCRFTKDTSIRGCRGAPIIAGLTERTRTPLCALIDPGWQCWKYRSSGNCAAVQRYTGGVLAVLSAAEV